MHDIKYIRDNPDAFDSAMKRRGLEAQSPALIKLDEDRRAVQTALQNLQQERNTASKLIGILHNPKSSEREGLSEAEFKAKVEETTERVSALKDEMTTLEEREGTLAESLNQHLAGLPNIMADDVPDGADEADNVEIRKWGEIKSQSGPDHVEIGEQLGMIDFETAAKMSGARFTLLSGGIARLERALAQFFLDTHTAEHGFTEMSTPILVRDQAMFWTDKLPKFADDSFKTTDDYWLIPTSEVTLTSIVAETILDEGDLNKRFTAFTPCFRSEAGSAGKDTRGMLRQHQFYKVEMVSITKPEDSEAEHEFMTQCAETVLQKLDLPYRTVVLCSGDTGFGATKTHDIEVWLPGQETYREISSVSNCGDFQARRMKARFKRKGEKKAELVHTLNGSGVAVGRALIAVIENYWDGEGVVVPKVLKPYMGGVEKVVKA